MKFLGIRLECFKSLEFVAVERALDSPANYLLTDFEGKEAFELYLVSYQLILRKQIWWLVHDRGLPSELEVRRFELYLVTTRPQA